MGGTDVAVETGADVTGIGGTDGTDADVTGIGGTDGTGADVESGVVVVGTGAKIEGAVVDAGEQETRMTATSKTSTNVRVFILSCAPFVQLLQSLQHPLPPVPWTVSEYALLGGYGLKDKIFGWY